MVKPRNNNEIDAAHDDDIIGKKDPVASADMCHYCFDVLLKKLVPKSVLLAAAALSSSGAAAVSSSNDDSGANTGDAGGTTADTATDAAAAGGRGLLASSPKPRRWMKKSHLPALGHDGKSHDHSTDNSNARDDTGDRKKDSQLHDTNIHEMNITTTAAAAAPSLSLIPPHVKCPLFVTWDKKCRSSYNAITETETATSSSNITDDTATSTNDTSNNNNNNTSNNNTATDDENDDSNYNLRGCIGTLSTNPNKPLPQSLSEFALHAALHDKRFDPICLREVPLLRVGVSLLVNYEECCDCWDWVVGVHGIIIRFEIDGCESGNGGKCGGGGECGSGGKGQRQREYSATYLPEVAYEQRWSQEEAVTSLVRKAGYRGSIIHKELLRKIKCTRYQSSKYRLTYRQYSIARYNKNGEEDPLLKYVDGVASTSSSSLAVDEVLRQKVKASKPCVNL